MEIGILIWKFKFTNEVLSEISKLILKIWIYKGTLDEFLTVNET